MHAEMHFDNALASAGEVRHLSKEDTESRQSSSCRSLPCWRSRHWLCSFHSSASTSGAGPGRLLGADHLTTHGLHAGQNDCQNMWHLHYHRSKLCPLAGGLHLPVTTSIRATQLATIITLHWELLDGFDGCVMSFHTMHAKCQWWPSHPPLSKKGHRLHVCMPTRPFPCSSQLCKQGSPADTYVHDAKGA